jgi:tight adherence protein B
VRERLLNVLRRCDPRVTVAARRRRRALDRQLPLAAEVIAAHVRAGRSLAQAIAEAAEDLPEPTRALVLVAAAELALGAAPADALGRLGGSADVRLMAEAVRLQGRAGGDMAELLDGIARLLHARAAERRAAEVATAQARYTGRLVTLMPAFGLAALWVVDRPGLHLLGATWAGRAALCLAVLLAAAGHALIGRIAAVAE